MKYAVDRIEEDIAILENIKNKKILKVDISLLPPNTKESSIIIVRKDKYILSKSNNRKNKIRKKFNRLKKLS